MYAQLGNIIFQGIKSFNSYSSSSEETYAQHERVNGKPSLQHTGQGLEQISLTIRFHVAFCNPAQELQILHQAKEAGEILPYINGAGEYKKDYVITSLSVTHDFTDKDGSLLSCSVSFSLLEYVSDDRAYQQELAARKAAFALGDKRPVTTLRTQPPTDMQQCAQQIGAIGQQGAQVDIYVSTYQDNVSQRNNLAARIQAAFDKMGKAIQQVNNYITSVQNLSAYSAIIDACSNIKNNIKNFQFPVTDIDILRRNNTELQAVLRIFKRVCGSLLNTIAIRMG